VTEKILAYVPQFKHDTWMRVIGDLVFTDQRVLFATTAVRADLAELVLGAIGRLVVARRSRRESDGLRHRPLSAIEAATDPENRIAYNELAGIEVKPRSFLSSVILLRLRSGRRKRFWGSREDLNDLLNKADSVAASGAPLSVKG